VTDPGVGSGPDGAAAETAMRELVGDESVMRAIGDRLDAGDDLLGALRAVAAAHPARAAAIGALLASSDLLDDLDSMLAMLLGTGSDVEGRPLGPRGGSLP
jgi:hypothetical protein